MEIVTSWMQEGIERGLVQGRQQGELALIKRLLNRRFGSLTPQLQERIQSLSVAELEDLGEALLDFSTVADLEAWLSDR
ncbi:DUF4351 domain-containing protein [Fortiea contorta]|uniref:DUF4351 domain-containing protein n=1 Tax=Fortiea contorta TaxID=1892405 RepID=UPI0003449207